MDELRIEIETMPQPNMLRLHFRCSLKRGKRTVLVVYPLNGDLISDRLQAGAGTMLLKFDDILGLEDAVVWAYHMEIKIARLFTWAEILPQVRDAIREAFNVSDLNITYAEPVHGHFSAPPRLDIPEIEVGEEDGQLAIPEE